MIVVIDNYDSFTYNLVQYLGEAGADLQVFRNDAIDATGIRDLAAKGVVISPGPGRPEDAGNSKAIIQDLHQDLPILGVCLGHQAIGEVFGGETTYAPEIMHGKTSMMQHNDSVIYDGVPSPFEATRYHLSLIHI